MKLYSKFEPGVYAETFVDEPDKNGLVPAVVYGSTHPQALDEEGESLPIHSLVILDEWSTKPLAPVPEAVPSMMFLVFSGDPLVPDYDVVVHEDQATRLIRAKKAWGYIGIPISRTMIVHPD